MGFELYEKGHKRLAPMEVSITKTIISLGEDASKFLNGDFVEVYLDRERNMVGFKASKNSVRGFKIQDTDSLYRKKISSSISKMIPAGIYAARIEDKFLVFNVSEIARQNE